MERKEQLKQLLSNTNALLEAMRYSASTATGSSANVGNYSSYKMFMRKYNDLAKKASSHLPDVTILDQFDLNKVRESGDTTWPQQKEHFDIAYSNVALLKSLLEGAIGYAEDQTQRLRDFIQVNLRKSVFGVPQKEVEIQNGLESLFVGRGMTKGLDYDRETGRVKTSGKESVPDFVIPRLKLCIEVKIVTDTR